MTGHPRKAKFVSRDFCVNCGSSSLQELASGMFWDEPLRTFIANDPWGENPLPFLTDARWTLVKCEACAQVFHRSVLDAEWNERRFSIWMNADAINTFEANFGTSLSERKRRAATAYVEHILRIEAMTKPIRKNEPVRLLDFGCGWGGFVEGCQLFGFDAVGLDRSSARIGGATIKVYSTIDELSSKSFHAVTAFEVLEHVDAPAEIVASLSAMLVPGGIFVAETPNCAGVTNIVTHDDYLRVHPLDHINAYTNETLTSLIERHGLKRVSRPVAYVTADPMRALKTTVKHALGRVGRSTQLYFSKDR